MRGSCTRPRCVWRWLDTMRFSVCHRQSRRCVYSTARTRTRGSLGPIDAVAAWGAGQRRLVAEGWPENTPIHVRMGVHTGVTEGRSSNYFGPVLNRCARLMSAGHGGQVLLSTRLPSWSAGWIFWIWVSNV